MRNIENRLSRLERVIAANKPEKPVNTEEVKAKLFLRISELRQEGNVEPTSSGSVKPPVLSEIKARLLQRINRIQKTRETGEHGHLPDFSDRKS